MNDLRKNPQPILPDSLELTDMPRAEPCSVEHSAENLTAIADIKLSSQQALEKGFSHFLLMQYVEALKLFNQAAESGYFPGVLFLGIMYKNGWGGEKNIEQSNVHFKKIKENLSWFKPDSQTDPFLLYCLGELSVYDKDRHCNLKPAAEYFQKAADLRYVPAYYKLGLCFQQGGYGVEQNFFKAVEWLELADKAGMAEAANRLGFCYYSGRGVIQDREKAVAFFQRAVRQGSVLAKTYLGECYWDGEGIPKDVTLAATLFQQAAQQGAARAQRNLAICYFEGEGVPKDEKQGVYFLQQSARQGLVWAQYQLGECYLYGTGLPKNNSQAFALFNQAAEQGLPEGENSLAVCYLKGFGVPKDAKQAINHLQKAEQKGIAEAAQNLGYCYLNGVGVPKDEKKAVGYFHKAADQGNTIAQYHLGFCYIKGLGVDKDKIQGMLWLGRSASGGNVEGIRLLNNMGADFAQYAARRKATAAVLQESAIFAKEISNVPALEKLIMDYLEDPSETATAIECDKQKKIADMLRLKADRSENEAQFELGQCYRYGKGIDKDIREAVKYFRQAQKNGYMRAKEALEHLPVETRKWYKFKAKLGYSAEQFLLANCYEFGCGTPKNVEKALFWYKQAARKEEPGAQVAFEKLWLVSKSSSAIAGSASFWGQWTLPRDAELPKISVSEDAELSSLLPNQPKQDR